MRLELCVVFAPSYSVQWTSKLFISFKWVEGGRRVRALKGVARVITMKWLNQLLCVYVHVCSRITTFLSFELWLTPRTTKFVFFVKSSLLDSDLGTVRFCKCFHSLLDETPRRELSPKFAASVPRHCKSCALEEFVSWDITPCCPVKVNGRFAGTHHLAFSAGE